MLKKRKAKKRTSNYKPVFTGGEHKLMQNYGVGNLVDEVGVNRIMLLRTMDKMNQEIEHLSFRDHLDAMRAVAYTTGRIASLLDTRERLYQPYKEMEERYNKYMDEINQAIEDFSVAVLGQEQWDEIQAKAWRNAILRENNRR
jgi:hypothetical protein